jgi:hypothetical protein
VVLVWAEGKRNWRGSVFTLVYTPSKKKGESYGLMESISASQAMDCRHLNFYIVNGTMLWDNHNSICVL